ncbi:MAG: amidohydrolase family protein [Proteobacteria bacterium]|nr:amidohydrolase family protein [Pseudomonadota bacterium]
MDAGTTVREIENLIDVAMGNEPADLVVKNGKLICVFTGEILDHQSVGIKGKRIAYVGEDPQTMIGDDTCVIDTKGRYIVPGLIDGHNHVDSVSRCSEFARWVLPRGTTTVITEVSTITNALGVEGMKWFIRDALCQPMRFYFVAPPLVPPYPEFESSRDFDYENFRKLLRSDYVVGVGETYWTRVLEKDRRVLSQYAEALHQSKVLDGHAAGAKGPKLRAYAAAGTTSCHESVTSEEVLEKLRLGMHVMIREGFIRHDLEAMGAIKDDAIDFRRLSLVSDTMSPRMMVREGLMNAVVKKAVSLGFDPVRTVQMASINAAERYGLKDLGGISPGKLADILVVEDLKDFNCAWVIVGGEIVAQGGILKKNPGTAPYSPRFCKSIRIPPVHMTDFHVPASGSKVRVNIVRALSETITDGIIEEVGTVNGNITSDPNRDILKMTVINKTSEVLKRSVGFVNGIGLKMGAVATSLVWDTYNVLALGVSDWDIALAVNHLREIGGGVVVTDGECVLAELGLPIGGVISDLPMDVIADRIDEIENACKTLGSSLQRPYLTIQTLAFTGLPFLRLTDKGLLDLRKKQLVDVIVSPGEANYGGGPSRGSR